MENSPEMIKLIERFYAAFQQRDVELMRRCYHRDVIFADPVFGMLKGGDVIRMWTMLCARGADLVLTFSDVRATEREGSAHWEADYTFGQTRRKVHNVVDAQFAFKDGLIIHHTDRFSFPNWARQALGITGVLFGWTPILQTRVRDRALVSLWSFVPKQEQ